jgi:hypothetical protein
VTPRHLAVWAGLGALVAVPLDLLHVVTGVLSYSAPDPWMPLGKQAWWAIPLFVAAGLALGLGHRFAAAPLSERLTGRAAPPTTWGGAAAGVACVIAAYASSGLLQRWPVATLLLYVAAFVAVLWAVEHAARPSLALHAVGTAVVGPVVEALISGTGAFQYARPDALGVTMWLPGIYLHAGVASHLLDRALRR